MPLARILEHASRNPTGIAIINDGEFVTYEDFARRIAAARAWLSQCGLPRRGTVALCLPVILDVWIAGLAVRSLGLHTVVPLHPHRLPELGLTDLAAAVTPAGAVHPRFDGLAARHGWKVIPFAPPSFGTSPTDSWMDDNTGGHILLTSGTTGSYKKVLRDAVAERRSLDQTAGYYGIDESTVGYVSSFHPWTAGGYRWPMIIWGKGGTVVIHQSADVHQPLCDHAMTHVFMTPDLFARLIEGAGARFRKDDSVRLFVTGSAMPRVLRDAARELITSQVYSLLASTEGSILALTPLETDEDLVWHRVLPSREAQIVDGGHHVLGAGKPGVLRVRPADGVIGYLGDEAGTREFFHDGYFYPGDVGVLREDGRLAIHGRSADVLNVLGDKVNARPYEQALEDRLGVSAVCVLIVSDARGDDSLVVVVESRRAVDDRAWAEARQAELRSFERLPIRLAIVERFPRNSMGKIMRAELEAALGAPDV